MHIISKVHYNVLARQIEYKAIEKGATTQKVNMFYASSKICSQCNIKNQDITLKVRSWTCACGAFHDCDINAAINIRNEAINILAASSAVLACGDSSSGSSSNAPTKLPSVKQESNKEASYHVASFV